MKNLFNKFRKYFNKSKPQDEFDEATAEYNLDDDFDDLPDIPSEENIKPEKKSFNAPKINFDFFNKIKNRFFKPKEARFTNEPKIKKQRKNLSQLDWQNIVNSFFNPNQRTKIHRIFIISFLFLSIFVLGKFTGLLLKGTPNYSDSKATNFKFNQSRLLTAKDTGKIKKAKIFKTDTVVAPTSKPKDVKTVNKPLICKKASRKSSLPIKLINTIVLQDSVKSVASVQVRSGNFIELREGDKIETLAKLEKIDRMNLVIKNLESGDCESISNVLDDKIQENRISVMSPSQAKTHKKKLSTIKGIKNEGNSFKLEKKFMQEKLKDISSILTQARGIKIQNPDGSLSFRLVEIDPEGIFAHLGVVDNDIITHINGKPINDLNEVMALFGKVSSLDSLELTIDRGGSQQKLDYSFQ